MEDKERLTSLSGIWTKDPGPIQNYQSYKSKFENIRRFEAQERERDARRSSNDAKVEALIVIGLVSMVIIPILIWFYYKHPICNPVQERNIRRWSDQSPNEQLTSHTATNNVSEQFDSFNPVVIPLKSSGFKCSKPSCVFGTKDEVCTSAKKSYRKMMNAKNDVPYGPAKA